MTQILLTQGRVVHHVCWPSVPREGERVQVGHKDPTLPLIIDGFVVRPPRWSTGGVVTIHVGNPT